MDYNNIDLNSHEVEQNIIDDLSFKNLLLQIDCNLPKHKINKGSVQAEFDMVLWLTVESAKDIFKANLNNIIKEAKSR